MVVCVHVCGGGYVLLCVLCICVFISTSAFKWWIQVYPTNHTSTIKHYYTVLAIAHYCSLYMFTTDKCDVTDMYVHIIHSLYRAQKQEHGTHLTTCTS